MSSNKNNTATTATKQNDKRKVQEARNRQLREDDSFPTRKEGRDSYPFEDNAKAFQYQGTRQHGIEHPQPRKKGTVEEINKKRYPAGSHR